MSLKLKRRRKMRKKFSERRLLRLQVCSLHISHSLALSYPYTNPPIEKEIQHKKLQNPVMQLRLACNSPHNFYWPWETMEDPDYSIVTESGKMILLDRLVPALFERGHKVLIFSQFKTQLDIIED